MVALLVSTVARKTGPTFLHVVNDLEVVLASSGLFGHYCKPGAPSTLQTVNAGKGLMA